jgi:hypothetical protein
MAFLKHGDHQCAKSAAPVASLPNIIRVSAADPQDQTYNTQVRLIEKAMTMRFGLIGYVLRGKHCGRWSQPSTRGACRCRQKKRGSA